MASKSSVRRVVHLTTVHPADDPRIFHKECVTLGRAGFEVTLIAGVPEVGGSCGIRHVMLPPVSGRLQRVLVRPWSALHAVLGIRPDLCHFHDPELLLAAIVLRKVFRIRVIYDVHEDVPLQILSKYWIKAGLRPTVAALFRVVEDACARRCDAIVAATPTIARRFQRLNRHTVCVANFPLASEFGGSAPWPSRSRSVAYIGAITFERGIIELLSALAIADAGLILAGPFASKEVEMAARAHPEWARVEYLGRVDREGVQQVLRRARVGVVCLHPIANYVESQPVKMFEYMAAGLPVVASDFPLWREFVRASGAGELVNPLDVGAIGRAIGALLDDESKARRMGEAGRAAVAARFSWEAQSENLLRVYSTIGLNSA